MTDEPAVTPPTRVAPRPFRADAERVEEPIASVLIAFGLHDVAVPEVQLSTCISASAGPLQIESFKGDIGIEGRSLRLSIPHRMAEAESTWNQRGTFLLEDGSKITARLTNYSSSSMSANADGLARFITTFTLDVWSRSTHGTVVAWVGTLRGLKFEQGNLGLWDRARDCWRRVGLRLRGHYTWYLLGNGREGDPVVVVDCGTAAPDFELLRQDLVALEFVCGCATMLDLLVGVDAELQPVGALGPHFGFRVRHGDETWPPIPDRRERRQAWAASLVPRLVAKLAEPDDRTFVAITGYMDSLVDHVDGAYLKAQVALEAYCAVTDDDCKGAESCTKGSKCRASNGECRAQPPDCKGSFGCTNSGECSLNGTFCEARTDDDCKAAEICTKGGACKAERGSCVPSSDAACKAAEFCRTRGRCTLQKGQGIYADFASCNAVTDDDCKASEACSKERKCRASNHSCAPDAPTADDCKSWAQCRAWGWCSLRGSACEATTDTDCRNSTACSSQGWCRASNGHCVR